MHPITLEWNLSQTGDQLQLSYTVSNTSTSVVYLLDQLVVPSSKGLEPGFDRVIVRNADTPGVVSFARGFVRPDQPMGGGVYVPAARRLDPGKQLEGKAVVSLPLAAWHNFAPASPLIGSPTSAVLDIGYLPGHDKWTELKLSDGTTAKAPGHPFVATQKFIRAAQRKLPTN